jgi:hypothetical protein
VESSHSLAESNRNPRVLRSLGTPLAGPIVRMFGSARALWVMAGLLATAAVVRLGFALRVVVTPWNGNGASDMAWRIVEVHEWFAGRQVYGVIESADYPPAAYLFFWPIAGWVDDMIHLRWVYAAAVVVTLLWFASILVREMGVRRLPAMACLALLPLASYSTFSTVVAGQVAIFVLPAMLTGVFLLVRSRGWRDDILGSIAVIAALTKPTIAVPITWVAFIAPGRIRPVLLITGGYLALTLFSAGFQPFPLPELIYDWLYQYDNVKLWESTVNLQKALEAVGAGNWFMPTAMGILLLTGLWVYRHRHIDVWVLIGVTALVARLWSYHRRTDDVIVMLAGIALLRLATMTKDERQRWMHGLVGGLLVFLQVLPLRFIVRSGYFSMDAFNELVLTPVWLAALGYLLWVASRMRAEAAGDTVPVRPNPGSGDLAAATLASGGAVASATGAEGTYGAVNESWATDPWRSVREAATGLSVWRRLCAIIPTLTLMAAFVWLCIAHGTLWPWTSVVHEGGSLTLVGAILDPSHLLREVPIAVAMVLFLFAAYGPPKRSVAESGAARLPVPYVAILWAAAALPTIAFAAAAIRLGPAAALNDLLQYTTRAGGALEFGSHWRHHWLSTLWFGIAAVFGARLGALVLGGPVPADRDTRRPFELAAWAYFTIGTVVFGVGSVVATDPVLIGSQAREIATHALVTLPLALALYAWLDRRHNVAPPDPGTADAVRVEWYHLAFTLAIPMYLAVIVKGDNVVSAGQTDGGLVAMVGAHFFEHTLEYALVALLTAGTYGLLRRTATDA